MSIGIIFIILLPCYILVSGIIVSTTMADRAFGSPNKMLVYFVTGFLLGWLILPIMFILGLKEIYDEWRYFNTNERKI